MMQRRKNPNKYADMSYEELLNAQKNVRPGKDCRDFHKALCKMQKDIPFWERGMPLHSRYPDFPFYFSLFSGAFVAVTVFIVFASM